MASQDATNQTIPTCAGCGTQLAGGAFCPGCGQPAVQAATPFAGHHAAAQRGADVANGYVYDPAPPPPPIGAGWNPEHYAQPAGPYDPYAGPTNIIPPSGPPPSANRWPFVIGAFAVLAIAIAVIVVLVLSSGSSDGDTKSGRSPIPAYQQRVVAAYRPVDDANRHVSAALTRLRTGRSASAEAAVTEAQSATSSAKGALGALDAPPGGERLAAQMRQVLDRETSYLQAVQTALTHPSATTAAAVQPLASNLTSDLGQIGQLSSSAGNVRGADNVTTWAVRTRRAEVRKKHAAAHKTQRSNGGSPSAPPNPFQNGRDCGGGVHAGPNTSCAFAINVYQAWLSVPGAAASLDVYSPQTGLTYTMDCRPAGSGYTCTGGNNASVSWGG
jgi:hypothetical protein